MNEKAYLAGPMSGVPHFNQPTFNAMALMLRERGFEIFNPVESVRGSYGQDFYAHCPNGDPAEADVLGFDLRDQISRDLAYICDHANRVFFLPGWERSFGARAEHATAVCLGLPITYLTDKDVKAALQVRGVA